MGKQAKMIQCKQCRQEIAPNAKFCPKCGAKNKRPFFKKPWFWVLAAAVVLVAAFSGGNKSDTAQQPSGTQDGTSQSGTSGTKATEPANVQTVYKVGDTLHDGNLDIVYVASGDYEEENQYMQPGEGKKYIFLKFAFINTSEKQDDTVSSYSFKCYADGYAADAYYGGDDDISATLSAGRMTEGSVYFQVPTDAQEIEVEYETNFFTEKKIHFAFEGDKDSGYTLTANTTATEGALKVGETLEGKTLNITYLSCFEDSSDNMFITPKEGCRFITCELEFENVSKSDVAISSFSFDCFADGLSCDATYFRDDNLSATISAGRKVKGTVTFEVPVDATTVEVEYLTNFWTSNRVVFDATVS